MTWNATFLRATKNLRSLSSKYFWNVPQYDPTLNIAFIKKLEETFQQHDNVVGNPSASDPSEMTPGISIISR